MVNKKIYYVYAHIRSSDGKVFYIGKGSGRRIDSTQDRSDWWNRTVSKHGYTTRIIRSNMTECCAFSLEKALIFIHRKIGSPLVNICEGGQGKSTGKLSIETRIKMRDSSGGSGIYCSNGMFFETLMLAADWCKGTPSPISASCRSDSYTAYGYRWSRLSTPTHPEIHGAKSWSENGKKRSIPVNTNMGERFESIISAARWLSENGYPKASQSAISKVVGDSARTAYGRNWFST